MASGAQEGSDQEVKNMQITDNRIVEYCGSTKFPNKKSD